MDSKLMPILQILLQEMELVQSRQFLKLFVLFFPECGSFLLCRVERSIQTLESMNKCYFLMNIGIIGVQGLFSLPMLFLKNL